MKQTVIDSTAEYVTAGVSGAGLAVGLSWGEELLHAFIIGAVGGLGGLVVRFIWRKLFKRKPDAGTHTK